MLGVSYPIVQGGMVWMSGWRLATAVSKCGGFGLIGAGSMRPDLLREHIKKAKKENLPFGVNIPLLYKYAPEFIDVVIEENVQVVFTSAGNPATFTKKLKDNGIKVVAHVVANRKFAEKAQKAGCDLLVAEGFEAGGHNGREELTTMVLTPLIKSCSDVPVLSAGGIATGSAWLAAEALGADGVQIGSRFAITEESSGHDKFKQAVTMAGDAGTILALKKLAPVRLLRNPFAEEAIKLDGASAEEQAKLLGHERARQGMFEGDMVEGELEIGQVSCLMEDIPSVVEVFDRLLGEYEIALHKMKTP